MSKFKAGDRIGWKNGIEQSGIVIRTKGEWLTVKCWDDMAGEYYNESVDARRAWKEE